MLFLVFPLQCLSIMCSTEYSPKLVKETVRFQPDEEPLFYNYIFKILLILSDIRYFENKYRYSNEI